MIYDLNNPDDRLRLIKAAPEGSRRRGMAEVIRRHCGVDAVKEVATRLREHRPS